MTQHFLDQFTQEDMEAWFREILRPGSEYLSKGLIPKLELRFDSCDVKRQELKIVCTAQPWQVNPEGILHGGITASFFDTILGVLTHYFAKPCVLTTTGMHIDYIKPIAITDTVEFTARIISLGKTLTTVQGEARLQKNGRLAANCISTYMRLHHHADGTPVTEQEGR